MRILRCLNTGLFLLPGGLFSRGKAGFLPAGTAAEPSLALCRRAGRLMFLLVGCWGLRIAGELFHQGSSGWAWDRSWPAPSPAPSA